MKSLIQVCLIGWILTIPEAGLGIGLSGNFDRVEAAGLANLMADAADGLHIEARGEGSKAFARENYSRSRQFRALAHDGRTFAGNVVAQIIEQIYTGASARDVQRALDRLTPECDRLGGTLRSIPNVPGRIGRLFDDIVYYAGELSALLNVGDTWVGSCHVVRETVWGTNIEDYYGTARATSQVEATNLAREDGKWQCERELGNLQKCTVVEAACFAERQ